MAVIRKISIKVDEKDYINFLGSMGYVGYDDATKECLEYMIDDIMYDADIISLMKNRYVRIIDTTVTG